MSLVGTPIEVGEIVTLTARGEHERVGTTDYIVLEPETELVVTRVYNTTLQVRTVGTVRVPAGWGGHHEDRRASFNISRELLDLVEERPGRPRPRKLGRKPEDTEDMTYVRIDDPGLQWLFDDMGRYATEQGYCPQYDALCAKLGIPGRERQFDVKITFRGIELTGRVMARSQREANEKVQKAVDAEKAAEAEKELDSPLNEAPDPDFAPAA